MDDETSEDYWDDEESSSSLESETTTHRDPTTGRFASRHQPPMKNVKPKPLKTLLGNDLTIPKKRKITLE